MEQQMSIFGPTVGHVFMTLDTYPAACAIDTELAGSAAWHLRTHQDVWNRGLFFHEWVEPEWVEQVHWSSVVCEEEDPLNKCCLYNITVQKYLKWKMKFSCVTGTRMSKRVWWRGFMERLGPQRGFLTAAEKSTKKISGLFKSLPSWSRWQVWKYSSS